VRRVLGVALGVVGGMRSCFAETVTGERLVSRESAQVNAMDGVLSGERWLVFFVARAFQPEHCPSAIGMPCDRCCWAGGQFCLTRSREGKRSGLLWCVLNCLLSFQLSRIYSLWHGCHVPLTPGPSPPFHGGEGRIVCFFGCESATAPLAPGRGEGTGVRGKVCSPVKGRSAFQTVCLTRSREGAK